jgi:hypothetical protein
VAISFIEISEGVISGLYLDDSQAVLELVGFGFFAAAMLILYAWLLVMGVKLILFLKNRQNVGSSAFLSHVSNIFKDLYLRSY